MCGFVGIVGKSGIAQAIVDQMSSAIAHRGPDGHGEWIAGEVCLVHRRLSVQDIEGGAQPMISADGRYIVVYNGEIYNFPSLKDRLEREGVVFRTHCDTEVLLHLFERHGPNFVEQLRGMFAFAIWDRKEKSLLLARDHIGQKPLFYAIDDGVLFFGSEIKGILASGIVKRELNLEALWHHTGLRFCPSDMTLFKGISKLQPGHLARFDAKSRSISTCRYWRLDYEKKSAASFEEAVESGYELISRVVKEHLLSDVPVGSFLSGGVDSSLVAALAANASQEQLKTFSIGSLDSDFSELPFAKQASELLGTDHYEFRVKSNLMLLLPEIVWHMEEPGDPHAVGLYQLSELTRKHLKVCLGGDGGDEVFGGYSRYTQSKIVSYYQMLPRWLRKKLMAPIIGVLPESFGYYSIATKARWVHEMSLRKDAARHYHAMTFFRFPDSLRSELFSDHARAAISDQNTLSYIQNTYDEQPTDDNIDKMLYAEQMTRMPEHYLLIADRMSMAHGLESRVPLVDKDILEYSAALPSSYKIKDGKLKFILREIASRHYSEEFLYRTKQGFGFPMARWFRGELKDFVRAVFNDAELIRNEVVDQSMVDRIFDEHIQGKIDHNFRIWMILNMEVWYRLFILDESRESVRTWISRALGPALPQAAAA